jgi:hypothetical protein
MCEIFVTLSKSFRPVTLQIGFFARLSRTYNEAGGRRLANPSFTTPRVGAPAQTKRAFSQKGWMIRNLEMRCCAWLRITSALLSGSKTEPWGASTEELRTHQIGGLHGHLYSTAACDSDFRNWFSVEFPNRLKAAFDADN